jgi:predicted kinase
MAARATLHLISGMPCAGKTTYAARLKNERDAVHLVLDRWLITAFGRYPLEVVGQVEHARRVYSCRDLIWHVAEEFLRRGVDVILDDGFFLRSDRRDHAARARKLGSATAIHFIDTPLEVLRTRLVARNRDPGEYHFEIAPEALDIIATLYEPPADDEGAALVVVRDGRQVN